MALARLETAVYQWVRLASPGSIFYVCQTTGDVDCDQRGNVGDRETVSRHKLVSIQLAVHPLESLMHERTLRFTVILELLETALEDRTGVLNRSSDCRE